MPVQSLIMAAVLIAAILFAIYQTVPVLSFFLVIGFAAVAYSFAPLIREIFTKVKYQFYKRKRPTEMLCKSFFFVI